MNQQNIAASEGGNEHYNNRAMPLGRIATVAIVEATVLLLFKFVRAFVRRSPGVETYSTGTDCSSTATCLAANSGGKSEQWLFDGYRITPRDLRYIILVTESTSFCRHYFKFSNFQFCTVRKLLAFRQLH